MQAFLARYYQPLLFSLMVILVGVAFYAGFLEGKTTNQQPVVLSCKGNILDKLSIDTKTLAVSTPSEVSASQGQAQNGVYVGSKNGTKYYLPTCTAVKRINPQNYVWFQTAEDAQIQGYTQGSC